MSVQAHVSTGANSPPQPCHGMSGDLRWLAGGMTNQMGENGTPTESDIFRDTTARYLGYANEVGEAFKPSLPRWMYFGTYGVACLYATADAGHKGIVAHRGMQTDTQNPAKPRAAAACAVADTLLWQGLASVIIPGITINRVVAATSALTKVLPTLPSSARRLLPTLVGLATIPLIIGPIDQFVDHGMDSVVRPQLAKLEEKLSA